MSIENVKLNHPKLHRALQARMRLMLLDPAFEVNPRKQARFKKMKLHFNEGDGCYTNFDSIFLGLNFPFFDGDINKQFNTANTIDGHEVGHIHFTSKTDWNKFVYRAMREYGVLASFAKDILNILEDRRIERLMGLVYPSLQKNFFLLGYRSIGNVENEINEKLKTETPDALMKIMMIRNLLLYVSYTRILPNIKHAEIKNYLKECYPYVLYARVADETAGAVKATEKILEILKPLMEDFKAEGHGKLEALFKSKEVGTTETTSTKGLEEHSEKPEAVELPKEMEEMIKEMLKKVKEEMEKESEEEEGDEDGFVTVKSKEKEKESDKESGAGSGEGEGEDKDESKSSRDDAKSGESRGGKSSVRDFVEDIADNIDEMEAFKKELEKETKTFEEELKEPVTRTILEDLLTSDKKEKKQNFKAKKEVRIIEELDVKIDTELHRLCRAYFKERNKMNMFSRMEYEDLVKPLNQIIKKTVSQIREISQIALEDTLRNQRLGRLDRRSMINYHAFNDPKIFKSKEIEKKQLELEVMLLIDVSGSNNSQMLNKKNDTHVARYVMNQIVAILLHEILKKLKFKHSIWTFYEDTVERQRFSAIVDRSNCFDKDAGRYMKEVGAFANNRDGYSIRYAGEYLNRLSENPHRLMIVLSDGQPAAAGYGGHSAVEDVKQAVKDVEKKGSKVIGIFTGHESENKYFEQMYDNAIFCNNESIFDLPKVLKQLLVSEFQDIISQTV